MQAPKPVEYKVRKRIDNSDIYSNAIQPYNINSGVVNAEGVIFPVARTTANAPAYVKGGLYFDLTLNKLRVGGASGWETVTSV